MKALTELIIFFIVIFWTQNSFSEITLTEIRYDLLSGEYITKDGPIDIKSLPWHDNILASEEGLKFQISHHYKQGEYLIYDCKNGHFACVDEKSFIYCGLARVKSRREKHTVLACAPLRYFKGLFNCFNMLYKHMHEVPNKSFCLRSLDSSKKKIEEFKMPVKKEKEPIKEPIKETSTSKKQNKKE